MSADRRWPALPLLGRPAGLGCLVARRCPEEEPRLNPGAGGRSAGWEPGKGWAESGWRRRSEAGQLCFGKLAGTCALSPPSGRRPVRAGGCGAAGPGFAAAAAGQGARRISPVGRAGRWRGEGAASVGREGRLAQPPRARAALPGRDAAALGVCGSQPELRAETVEGTSAPRRASYPSRRFGVLSSAFPESSAKKSDRVAGGRVKLLAF